ncbi:MAG: sugar phosphate isomerase/epimerase [Planctomycetia bacterium]|nr:sugar phosphate isomerase/epimerase [Planctomycetia bacterium]
MNTIVSRRAFGTAVVAGVAASAIPAQAVEPPVDTKRWPIIGFTKPFTELSADETADLVAEVGWDGVELPVRQGTSTHVAPDRVEDGLPAFVEALRKRGKEVSIVTTSVLEIDAVGEKVLRTTAALGIKRVRLGFMRYPKEGSPAATVGEFRARLRDVAALAAELGLQAGYQNHSGADFVGAPVWDAWDAMKDLDARHVGMCFDIGHATLEGGLSWPIQARLLANRFVAVFCKDFVWEKTSGGQKPVWCPLGEGVVSRQFFAWLRTTGFGGPLSQHHEYPGLGTGREMVAQFKRDLARLREMLG